MNKFFAVICLVCSSIVLAEPELTGSPDELTQFLYPSKNVLSISGEAEETAYSDKAIVSLVVSTEDELLAGSIALNSNLRSTIATQLIESGFDSEDINSSKFSMSPEYGWFSSAPSSYKVVNRVSINIFDEEQLQDVARLADEYEEIQLTDTAFEHTQKDEYLILVKQKALDIVMEQKAFYESTLGIKLEPINFRTPTIRQQGTQGARVAEEIIVTARERDETLQSVPLSASYAGSALSSFDEVQYNASIIVDFEVSSDPE